MPTEKEIGGWVFSNNDHIIKMARSAGMHYSGACTLTGMESHLERFAALVAAHERERLAQPEQELKPWQTEETYDNDGVLIARRMKRGPNCEWEPWLTPPRREWVGLTDDELEMLELKHAPPVHPEFVKDDDWWEFARAIEAKLKEKNNAN